MADNKKTCIDCGILHCRRMEHEFPEFCPTLEMTDEFIDSAMELYEDPLNSKITIAAAEVEAEFYCQITRIEEIMVFAQKIGAKKLGIATCIGLMKEARTAAKIFRHNGFEVVGLSCKAGVQKKVDVGIDPKCNVVGENMCNPILQAKYLNEQGTDLNVVIGLCVGHDSLFYKYSEAPCTTLVTKDRVLGHNPAVALYQADAYYKNKLFK